MDFLWFLSFLRNDFLNEIFLLITKLGEETAFIALAIIVFWCVSKKDGYFVLSVGFIGTTLNQFLKLGFRIERPWKLDPSFKAVPRAIPEATGYSFPSGHTQNAVGTFGSLFTIAKKNWLRTVFVALAVLVAFSRMYLGVHTPNDVLMSSCIAIMLIVLLKPLISKIYESDKKMYIFLLSMVALSCVYLIYAHLLPLDIEPEYRESALKNGYTLFGALLGMVIAFPIERRYVKFDVSGKWYTQLFKCVIGLSLLLLVMNLLKIPLDNLIPVMYLGRTIRYMIVVVLAVVVYPLTFKLFKRLEVKIEEKRRKTAS